MHENLATANRATLLFERIYKHAAVNPASIADGAVGNGTLACDGVAVGDEIAIVPLVVIPAGVTIRGKVEAAGTVGYTIQNNSGGAYDMAASTFLVIARRYAY